VPKRVVRQMVPLLRQGKGRRHLLRQVAENIEPWPYVLYGLQATQHWESASDYLLRTRIKHHIKRQGLKMKDVAKRVNINVDFFRRILRGVYRLPPPYLKPLLRELSLPREVLLEGIEWPIRRRKPSLRPWRRPESDGSKQIRALVSHRLKVKGLTHKQLGQHLRVNQSFVSKVLRGEERLPDAWVERLAEILELEVKFLREKSYAQLTL